MYINPNLNATRQPIIPPTTQFSLIRIAFCGPIWWSGEGTDVQFSGSIWVPQDPPLRRQIQQSLVASRQKLNLNMGWILCKTIIPGTLMMFFLAGMKLLINYLMDEDLSQIIKVIIDVIFIVGCIMVAFFMIFSLIRFQIKGVQKIEAEISQINLSLRNKGFNATLISKSSQNLPKYMKFMATFTYLQVMKEIQTTQMLEI